MEEKKKFVLSEQEIREGVVSLIGEKDLVKYKTWLVESYMPNHPEFDLHSHDDRESLAKVLADEAIKWSVGREEYASLDDLALRDALRTESWAMAMFEMHVMDKLPFEERWGVYNKPCVCMAPYQDWGDGIKGCVLVLHWNSETPQVFLVDDDDRKKGTDYALSNSFLPYETRLHYNYVDECNRLNDGWALTGKEDYKKYKIILLAGSLESALLDDVSCALINTNQMQQGHRTMFNCGRFLDKLRKDASEQKLASDIAELRRMTGEVEDWRHGIIMKVLEQLKATDCMEKAAKDGLTNALNYWTNWLKNQGVVQLALIGQRMTAEIESDGDDFNWWEWLELYVNDKESIKLLDYTKYSIRQVIAFASYAKYLLIHPSFDSSIRLETLTTEERIGLFKMYMDGSIEAALKELKEKNDPLASALPTRDDATKLAIERIESRAKYIPKWLPEDVRPMYADYERAFRKFYAPMKPKEKDIWGDFTELLQNSTVPERPALVAYDMRKAMRYTMEMAEKWEKEAKEMTKMAMDRWWKKIPEDLREKAIAQKETDVYKSLETSGFLEEYAVDLTPGFIEEMIPCAESQAEVDQMLREEQTACAMADLYDGDLHILNDQKLEKHIYVYQNRLTEEQIFAFYDYMYEMEYLDKLKNVDNECDAAEQVVYDFISTEIYSYDAAIEKVKQVFGKSTAKAKKIRELYSLQNMKYVDINKYANDEKRAEVINQFVGKDQFTADDFVRARKPQKSQKSAVKKKE